MNKEKLLGDIKKIEKKQAKSYYLYLNKTISNNYNLYKDTNYGKYFTKIYKNIVQK